MRINCGGEVAANSIKSSMAIDEEVLVLRNETFKCTLVEREALEGVEMPRAQKQEGFSNMSELHKAEFAPKPRQVQ